MPPLSGEFLANTLLFAGTQTQPGTGFSMFPTPTLTNRVVSGSQPMGRDPWEGG